MAPDPLFDAEHAQWLATCPHCPLVLAGESPREAQAAWRDHEMHEHPPLPAQPRWGADLLDALLDPASPEGLWARWAVRDYWAGWRWEGERWVGFTGASFDSLGYTAGRDPNPDRFTATDIVAVSTLDVKVPAGSSLILLDDVESAEINTTLARVTQRPMHEVAWSELGPDSAAHELWRLVRNRETGCGRTTTSKLLARKRPHLVPVFDSRVSARMGFTAATDTWRWWWEWWQRPVSAPAVAGLRERAAAASAGRVREGLMRVSLLRVVDVAVWRYDKHHVPQGRPRSTRPLRRDTAAG